MTADQDADRILKFLRATPDWVVQGNIRRSVFGDNKPASIVLAKLELLRDAGKVEHQTVDTGGRPSQQWRATST